MRVKLSLSDKIIKRLGRPLTQEEATLLILAEIVLEEENDNQQDESDQPDVVIQ